MGKKILYSNVYGEGVECQLVLLEDLSMEVLCSGEVVCSYPPEVYKNMPKEKWVCEAFLEFGIDEDLLLDSEFLQLFNEMEEYNEKLFSETLGGGNL